MHRLAARAQPQTLPAPGLQRRSVAQGQDLRRTDKHHDPQVEAHAVAEGFGQAGQRSVADEFAVERQQRQAQQGEHQQEQDRAGGDEKQMAAQPDSGGGSWRCGGLRHSAWHGRLLFRGVGQAVLQEDHSPGQRDQGQGE